MHSQMNSQKSGVDKKLLVAIHDVGPKFDKEVNILASLITDILGMPRFSMLVVPNHWGEAPLWQAPAFCRRLRDWSDEGVEMFAHGWFHRDYSPHRGVSGLKARTMTAGEGEFLGLDRDEAARRMTDGKALIEDIIGREVAGFIAPAWLYGPGSREALQSSSYRLAEDHMRVWRPQSSKILAAGPVITWASRSRSRRVSSIAFAGFARKALRILPTVRIAVHPGDTARPELMTSLRRTITEFALQRQSSRYLDLIPSQADEAVRTNITKN